MMRISRSLFVTVLLLMPVAAVADESPPAPPRGHTPPPQAFDACKGKKDGDACSFEGRRGKVDGTCSVHRDGGLVCAGHWGQHHPPADPPR